MPLAAAIRDEQTANARQLVDAEAAIMVPEACLDPSALAGEITRILTNPDAARRMARGALTAGRPDAALALAEMVDRLGGS